MWKDVKYNDKYEVSELGVVRRKDTKRVLKGCITSGYRSVKLTFDNSKQRRFYVHRLVAEHYIINPDPDKKIFVNHIDGNKLNNNVSNLEFVTPRENNLHYYQKIQKTKKERKQGIKTIPIIQYDLNNNEIARYKSMSEAHKKTGISVVQISRCVHGETKQSNGFIWKENKEGSTTKCK